MKLLLPAALCLLAMLAAARAGDTTRSAQEELRRRNVYFGDINGRETPELTAAVQRYQKRKGFGPSGELDRDTLRSLGLLPRQPGEKPPDALRFPDEPVLRSDRAVDVADEARQIAAETGVAPESIAPEEIAEEIAEERKSGSAPERRRNSSRDRAPKPPKATGSQPPIDFPAQQVQPREMAAFVSRYLDATSCNDLRRELAFYGDRVNYYNSGIIDRRIIERRIREYYLQWPKRKHRVVNLISYRRDLRRGEIHLVFRVRSSLKNKLHRVEADTENHVVINAATEDPRIISISERRVRG